MEEKNDLMDRVDEVILPGFRFHPTDEELVGFYLKRKVQQKPLSIELIRQLNIYKYDPWDLPKLATTGEKEWYFYCPRDRKYRNSARPNRVTGAGFWKATGTDRPIYSSEGTKCIGLKKSLVFYKGRAAKGIKTDWMMHEFRLPSMITDTSLSKRPIDKNIPANDSWAICRIFKKTNSIAQRALSQSWVSPLMVENNRSSSNINDHSDSFSLVSSTTTFNNNNNNNNNNSIYQNLAMNTSTNSCKQIPTTLPLPALPISTTDMDNNIPASGLLTFSNQSNMDVSGVAAAAMVLNFPPENIDHLEDFSTFSPVDHLSNDPINCCDLSSFAAGNKDLMMTMRQNSSCSDHDQMIRSVPTTFPFNTWRSVTSHHHYSHPWNDDQSPGTEMSSAATYLSKFGHGV